MTEMKARLVDKDGNPLGTAANPLKISGDVGGGVPDGGTTGQVLQKKTDADQDTEWGDVSVATTSWGSITGTLADQTDLNMALGGKVPTTRTVNSKALSSDISLAASDVGAQPVDATLTALAGVTTASGKYPYFTGSDTAGVLDLPSGYNYIINPCFEVNQQAVGTYTSETTPANSDDTYIMDQWILLSDGHGVVDVSLDTSGAFAGCRCSLKADVETANKKFGFLQPFESVNSISFRNQVVSVSFKAKTASGKVINNLRCAILEWTGTADAITSDCVSAWGAQGTNPTWATSWAALNTPANLALTTSEQTFKIENITVGASTNNLAVFIWCDDTDAAVDDLLYLSAVKFEIGPVATICIVPRFDDELRKCQRFYQFITQGLIGIVATASVWRAFFPLPATMRAAPTVWLVGTPRGLAGIEDDFTVTEISANYSTADILEVDLTLNSSPTPNTMFKTYYVADSGFKLDARL